MTKTNKDSPDKFAQSIKNLEHALTFKEKAEEDPFYMAGITKSFETCMEYAWKAMKRRATSEGIEVYSPKDAIKHAGKLGLIDDVERWLDFLEDRNLAVHDYLGVAEEDYMESIEEFLGKVKLLQRVLGK